MIGRLHIVSFIVVVSLYLLVAIWKYAPGLQGDEYQATEDYDSERAEIVEFWDHYNKAASLRVDRDYQQAAYYYEKALELNDKHEDANYYLGSMYLFQRDFEKARQVWLKLEELQPNSPRTLLQLGTLYFCMDEQNHLYDRQNAVEKFSKAWDLNREETGSPLLMSKIAILEEDYERADELLDIVIASNSMDYQARYLRGFLKWMEKEERSSRELFREARDIYHSLVYSEIQGEGATESGARAMLSEDRFCDSFEIRIDELLGGDEMLDLQEHYEKFSQSLGDWRRIEAHIQTRTNY